MESTTQFACIFFLQLVVVSHGDQASFDCKMRQLAMDFARKIQPMRTKLQFQQLADALNGSPEAQNCNVTPGNYNFSASRVGSFPAPQSGQTFYVDSTSGSDSNPGTLSSPFKTIAKGVNSAQKAGSGSFVVLRKGVYYLDSPIQLTATNSSGMTIQSYEGEEAWVSGGKRITPKWMPYNVSKNSSWDVEQNDNAIYGQHPIPGKIAINGTYDDYGTCEAMCKANGSCNVWTWHDQNQGSYSRQCWFRFDHVWNPVEETGHVSGHFTMGPNIYVADLSGESITSVPGLRINGRRGIRARYPNADPELGFGSSLHAKSWIPPTLPKNPDKEVNPDTPLRTTSLSFQKYQLGIGGPCKEFSPPAGYWCGNATSGGGAFTYRVPSGMVADKSVLPNSPYKNPIGAVVQTWRPAHWASWMFEVGSYDSSTGTFMFSKGGFQGARGNDNGAEFYIENVFEELDYPDEWFFDEKSKMLYVWYNGTGAPPEDTVFEVTQLKTLFMVMGSQEEPVKQVSFKGLMFKDTAYTYLDPHGMPSGGDWALERMGALYFEGTENTVVDSCVLERLDGNGIMISGYNRGVTIQNNEFAWIGDSAIGSWGYTTGAGIDGMGVDGTDGNQPRFNKILNNFVHELGIWEKQSSFYFQAKTCQNMILGNIFFNGPRAGVNFNDGFGGASNLTENLLLNTCRESGDHGPFNSWDRQVFLTKVKDGQTASPDKQYDYITGNFMIANYNSQEAIDNDDGSNYYMTHGNFFVYSGNGMKNDFGGHDNHHFNNIYAYVGHGFGICSQLKGHEDYFYNNTVVMTHDGDYGNPTCSGDGMTVVHDNKIYTPNGNVTECKMSLQEWQAKGNDKGTIAGKIPDDSVIIDAARQLLGL